jgi:hypothetical protein
MHDHRLVEAGEAPQPARDDSASRPVGWIGESVSFCRALK